MPVPNLGFRLLAVVAAVSAWALVAVGGVVRIAESGLGCPDWPLCNGRVVPHAQKEPVLEYSHRATAAVVTILVLAVAVWALARYRSRLDVLVPALLAAAFIPFQAVLGAIVVWLELPGWIVGIHFVVGMLFLALSVLAAVAAWKGERRAPAPSFARLASATTAVGLVLVSVGAAVVSMHADHACGTDWPACNGTFVAGGPDAAVQVAHRTLAYVVAGLVVALAVLAWRGLGPRLAGTLPLVAVVAQMGFGIGLVVAGTGTGHEILGALHVAGSGAVWAALVALAAVAGFPARMPSPRRMLGAPVRAR